MGLLMAILTQLEEFNIDQIYLPNHIALRALLSTCSLLGPYVQFHCIRQRSVFLSFLASHLR